MKIYKNTIIPLVVLCALSFFLMLGSSRREAVVVDELAHITAGYSYLHFQDYRLNPEHPPLLKVLAAVPLQFMRLNFPTDNPFWTTAVNGQWGVGGAFLFGLKNNDYAIIQWARVFPILLTIGLALFTYYWARKLYGPSWALLPAAMVGLSPIVLAHGHYVTTDVAAAFGAMLGLFTFVRFLRKPNIKNVIIAGICLGLAELMKFSTIVLLPIFLFVLIFYAVAFAAKRNNQTISTGRVVAAELGRYFWRYLVIILIAYAIVVYPTYAVFTKNFSADKQATEVTSILGNRGTCDLSSLRQCAINLDISLVRHPSTRPLAQYGLGVLMNWERIVGTNLSYFLGHVYMNGTWLYFPVSYALKETLPALILLVVGFIMGLVRMVGSLIRHNSHFGEYVLEHLAEFSMILFVAAYWLTSIRSPLNIGVRHLLPIIPFMYILAASALRTLPKILLRNIFVGVMAAWLAVEAILAYPSYISYYNELAGGTVNGYRYADDSNYDWGQDMFAFRSWMNAHPEADKVALDFFGGSNPAYYLGDRYVAWQPSMGNPSSQNIHWFAISITNLQNDIQPGGGEYVQIPNQYQWLKDAHPQESGLGGVPKPDFRVGTSIFVYKL